MLSIDGYLIWVYEMISLDTFKPENRCNFKNASHYKSLRGLEGKSSSTQPFF